jgi:hypothetical protein
MYHFVYRTTCTLTSNYYVGVHSTSNLDDGYLGSGLRVRRSIQKNGESSHVREILRFFETAQEAYDYEKEIVTDEFISNPLVMNIVPGGKGGWGTSAQQSVRWAKANAKMNELRATDPTWVQKFSHSCSESNKESYLNGTRQATGFHISQEKMVELSKTDEALKKRRDSLRKIDHQQGEKNSQYGTCWVTKDGHTLKVKLQCLDTLVFLGYRRGRK